jgi:hypothetical protein
MRQLTANSRLGKYTRLSREKRKEELTDHLQGLTIYIAGGRNPPLIALLIEVKTDNKLGMAMMLFEFDKARNND